MKVELETAHRDLLESVAKNNGFKNPEIVAECTSSKGDGYMGSIAKVLIREGNKKLHVVLKTAHKNETLRKGVSIRDYYLKEIYCYDVMLENFEKFQRDNGLFDGFNGYARVLGTLDAEPVEALVMEDLSENMYRLWDRKSTMDPRHVEIVMREFGKFHAVSFAMRYKQPELFGETISQYIAAPLNQRDIDVLVSLVSNIALILPKAVRGDKTLVNAARKVIDGAQDFFAGLMEHPEWLVIRHGDCWCNNMLFRYEDPKDPKRPTKVCLIDWQLARLGPGTLDLAHFFFASSSKEMLPDFRTYLKAYYDSFCEILNALSCDPEEIYPFESLVGQFKEHARFGLFLAPIVFRLLAVDSEEAPVLEGVSGKIGDFISRLSGDGDDVLVQTRLRDLLQFMLDNDMV